MKRLRVNNLFNLNITSDKISYVMFSKIVHYIEYQEIGISPLYT